MNYEKNSIQEVLKERVLEIVREEREKSTDKDFTIVQRGIESHEGRFVLILMKQSNSNWKRVDFYKLVDM